MHVCAAIRRRNFAYSVGYGNCNVLPNGMCFAFPSAHERADRSRQILVACKESDAPELSRIKDEHLSRGGASSLSLAILGLRVRAPGHGDR
jgi:hypothetical protein